MYIPPIDVYVKVSSGHVELPPRSGKGKSIIAFPDSYTVIDIETTGLDPYYCDIIELSALRYKNGELIDSFTSFARPTDPIDSFITDLTGITQEMVENAPEISDVILKFYDFIKDDTLVGYNVNFDINFIYDVLQDKHGICFSNQFVDVLRIARRLLPDLKNHKQKTVAAHYGLSPIAHRAYADCETCGSIFSLLRDEAIKQYGNLDDFLKSITKSNHGVKAKDVTATNQEFDEYHPLFGKTCVFTGALEKMTRKEAMQMVVNLGGICGDNVTAKTNYLILGNNDFCKSIKDGKSRKHKKAESLMLKGNDIEIMSEDVFYTLVFDN